MQEDLVTVSEAALAKGVSRTTIYAAVAAGRIDHRVVLGRIAIRAEDLATYEPTRYGVRPGVPGRGGRPPGRPMDERSRANISAGQQRRWAGHKHADPLEDVEASEAS